MKHIFVINPNAGKKDRFEEISDLLKKYDGIIDYEVYKTTCKGDGREYVRNYLLTHPKEETYRFYAIGGDGSLHDVVNGASAFENAEVACYPSGSGNDFIKNFKDDDGFRNLDRLIHGKVKKVDLLKANDKVSINIFNYGFDGEVTFKMHRIKRWPLMDGKGAYNVAAVSSLLFNMSTKMKVTLDDEVVFDDKGLLIAVANGHTYGGGYKCAPESKVDDGLIDVCLIKKISRFSAPSLMSVYKKGEHLTNKKLTGKIIYKKCRHVIIESPSPVAYAIDGEVFREGYIDITILPLALNFILPEGYVE